LKGIQKKKADEPQTQSLDKANTSATNEFASSGISYPLVPYQPIPYDEYLLERARTEWHLGDWQSLTSIDLDALQHHPDRETIALLAGVGRIQTNKIEEGKEFIRLAKNWGASKLLIGQVLVSCVHNSLGRAAAISEQKQSALQHFESAIKVGIPGGLSKTLTETRIDLQLNQIKASVPDGTLKYDAEKNTPASLPDRVHAGQMQLPDDIKKAWIKGQWARLAKLDNAALANRSNRAVLAAYAATGHQQLDDMEGLNRCTALAIEWGYPKKKLNRLLRAGMYNTLAIIKTLSGQHMDATQYYNKALCFENTNINNGSVLLRIKEQIKKQRNISIETQSDMISQYIEFLDKKND